MTKFAKALRQAAQDPTSASSDRPPVARILTTNGPAPLDRVPGPAPLVPEDWSSAEIADEHLVSLLRPTAFEAEQYRALRHIVEQMHRSANLKVLAVSSPAVGDGKTTTAINLAGALAQSPEAKVLLVDSDVRRPAIGALLRHVDDRPGLAEALLDPACTLEQMLVARTQFNLCFIHSGRSVPSRPYELLKSARFGELLEEARARFDYIILDTPPLAVVQDCRLIARWVDGFVIVVAAHRTPRRLVEEALAGLEPSQILGLVFNGDTDGRNLNSDGYAESYLRVRPSPAGRGRPRTRGPKWIWRLRA